MRSERRDTTLREALAALRVVQIEPSEFRPIAVQRLLQDLEQRFCDVEIKAPPRFDGKASYRAIANEFRRTGSFNTLTPRLRRQAPWVFFMQFQDLPVLAADRAHVTALIDSLRAHGRPRDTASLLHRFLLYYPKEWSTWDQLRTGLMTLLEQRSARLQGWRDRNLEFHYLAPTGAREFAEASLRASSPIVEVMARARLQGELEKGKFVEAAYRDMIDLVSTRLKQPEVNVSLLERFLEFSETQAGLRLGTMRAELANGLLEPFHNREPSDDVRSAIERFLARNLRHPGLNPSGWLNVSDRAQAVMLRWLVGTTLADFFHVLDRTANPNSPEGSRWRFRKAFWGAYHRKGHIRDAWVAVGPHARELLLQHRKSGIVRYGELNGATMNDCLLLLRIGGLTIAEWSHLGTCRLWLSDNRRAPLLYRGSYDKRSILSGAPDEAVQHHSSASYGWQSRISDYIRVHARATVSPHDYRVH